MAPTNDFLPFCGTDTGSNLLSQSDYVADAQRPVGNQPGVARSKLVNKAARQAAWIAAQFAQFISSRTGDDVLDDQNSGNILATMAKAFLIPSNTYYQGYHLTGNIWSISTSGSYIDPTSSGTTPSLVSRLVSGLTVTTAAGNLPGVTFTPASTTAVYKISANMCIDCSFSGGNTGSSQMTDGTTVIAQGADVEGQSSVGFLGGQVISGIYAPGTVSPVTVKIQLAVSAGTYFIQTFGLGNPIEWTIERIK